MKEPLVSIIMPVYNAMPYLEIAVKSIFAQTHKNWELIIVDDGSTDESWELIKNISDPRVRVFKQDKNMGHSWICNYAITKAKGEYIAKMDADDISLPTRLEKQFLFLKENINIDLVGSGVIKFDQNNNFISVTNPPVDHKSIVKVLGINKQIIFGPNFRITHGTYFGKSEWFKRYPYNNELRISQDFDLLYGARRFSKFANISEPLYKYRKGGVTESRKKKIKGLFIKSRIIIEKYRPGDDSSTILLLIFSFIIRLISILITPILISSINIFRSLINKERKVI